MRLVCNEGNFPGSSKYLLDCISSSIPENFLRLHIPHSAPWPTTLKIVVEIIYKRKALYLENNVPSWLYLFFLLRGFPETPYPALIPHGLQHLFVSNLSIIKGSCIMNTVPSPLYPCCQ